MPKPIVISILANASQANATLQTTATRTERLGAGFRKMRTPALLAVGAVTVLGKKLEAAGEAASTSDARTKQVFKSIGVLGENYGKAAARVTKSAEKMARTTGIDPNAIKQGQAVLGTFSKIAVSADKMGGTFDRATTLATDLSAAGFGDVKSASVLLGKALQDPVKGVSALSRVGVTLTDQQKEQVKVFSEAGQTAKAQEIILKAVESQVGGVAKATANASDKQKVAAQLAQESIGKKLAPMFDKFRSIMASVAGLIAKNSTGFLVMVGVLAALAAGVLIVNGAMAVATAATVAYTAVTKVLAFAQRAAAAAQLALNIAFALSPIGVIVVALAALAAAVVIAYKKSETFRAIVQAAWGAVQVAAAAVGGAIARVFGKIKAVVSVVGAAIKSYVNTFYVGPIRAIVSTVGRVGGAVSGAFGKAMSVVRGIGGKVRSAVSGFGTLLVDAGRAIISGLISGITDKLGGLYNKVAGIGSKIKSLKGPLSYDKVMLKPEGAAIIAGLISGIESEESRLYGTVGKISRTLAATRLTVGDARLGAPELVAVAGGGRAAGTVTYNVHVHVTDTMSPVEQGRKITKALKEYQRAQGAGR